MILLLKILFLFKCFKDKLNNFMFDFKVFKKCFFFLKYFFIIIFLDFFKYVCVLVNCLYIMFMILYKNVFFKFIKYLCFKVCFKMRFKI